MSVHQGMVVLGYVVAHVFHGCMNAPRLEQGSEEGLWECRGIDMLQTCLQELIDREHLICGCIAEDPKAPIAAR